jgi:hypothetical protein
VTAITHSVRKITFERTRYAALRPNVFCTASTA